MAFLLGIYCMLNDALDNIQAFIDIGKAVLYTYDTGCELSSHR